MRLPNTQNGVRFTSASELDRKVTLLKTESGTDNDGNPLPPTVFARDVNAKIQEIRNLGRLDPTQQLAQQVVYYYVTIRYRPGVTGDMTVLGPGGQIWAITSIVDVAQSRVELKMTVREANGGEA
jgi:SPP1 family predicted phage head-tail adaptor